MSRILTRTRVLFAELEATYGVDPVPTAAANAILCKSPLTITPYETTQLKRDLIVGYMGDQGSIPSDTYVKLDCEIELAGSGTAGTPPGYDPLLQACGLASTIVAATSVTYKPISAGFTSNTLYFYLPNSDGTKSTLHRITGVRGDLELNFAVKAVPTIKFTMTGLYNAPTGVAPPVGISFGKFIKPVPPNMQNTTGVSLFGYASPALEKFNLKAGNKVEFRNLVGDQYVFLSDRNSMGQVDFEAITPDVFDMFANALAGGPSAISFNHGTVAGNKIAVSVPAAQPQNPTYADSTGVQMFQVPYIATTTAGNDEFSLTFT